MANTTKTPARSLSTIARDIRTNWRKSVSGTVVYFGAVPYLDAMSGMDKISDNYGCDSGRSIVAYFLSNASTWRGPSQRK